MNNALLYLGGFLVVVFAALFAVPTFIDWNGYRGVFEEEASKVLGRDVRVGGAVNVRLLPTPYVRFEKVRLADLTGQTGEPFVRVESFTMRLAATPLLRGVLEANEIELTRPVLTLALDGKGGGNWSSIQIKPGALPFVPQNVALHSVKLIDGVLALYNPDAQPVARVEAINGEFSAEALNGPFKFKGRATWSGETHDIKFATTAPEADGSVRIKAASRAGNSTNTFTLDGKIEDFSGKPRLTGELAAKLAVPGSEPKSTDGNDADALVMDFKSSIAADAAGAKFDDIAMSLENAAEPQLITGGAKASWANEARFDLALNAKSLDLDRLAGAGQDSASFAKIKQLGLGVMKAVAGDGPAGARIDIEQIKIGGETGGGLRIDAERRGGSVLLKDLKVGLPGGSRLDMAGEVKDEAGRLRFAGNGYVHGTGLARLLAWAQKSGAAIDVKADGPFAAGGRLSISETHFELIDATAEISGRPFSGEFKMSDDGRRRVAVMLEGASLDSAELFPETARALEAVVRKAFGLGVAAESGTTDAVAAAAEGESEITLRLLTAELKHGVETFRNVDAAFGFEGGEIQVPSARFTTSGGLAVMLEGRIKDANGQHTGHIAYEVVGSTPDAMKDIARVFGLDAAVAPDRLAALGSGKAAGLIRLGERGKGTADVSLDGTLAAARVVGHAEFDNGLRAWRTAASKIQVAAKSADLSAILAGLGAPERVRASAPVRPVELVFATSGALATGAATLFDVSSEGLNVVFNGTAHWPDAKPSFAEGSLNVKAREVRDVLALAGADSAGGLTGIGAAGRIGVTYKDGAWTLASRQISLGDSTVSGSATLTRDAQGAAIVSADLAADRVPVTSLLAAVIDRSTAVVTQSEATLGPNVQAAPARSLWPESSFNFDSLGDLRGGVRVKFASLQLGDGLTARNGVMSVQLAPGKISMSVLSDQAAGGKLDAQCDLEKATGGVAFTSRLKLDAMELGTLSALGKGRAGLDVTARSRAQSPAGLMAVLSGTGQLMLEESRIPGPGPRTAADVVDAVLQNEIPNESGPIAAALEASLGEAALDAGTRSIAVTLADGVAKLEPASLETPDGKLLVSATVDLTTLALDSAWLVAPVVAPLPPPPGVIAGWVQPPAKGPLPAAAVVYSGSLDNLSGLNAGVDAGELQRELVVRQLERNVEELERLRRQDEERARLELERRKTLEAERVAAAAAARAAKRGAPLPPILPLSNGAQAPGTGAGQSPEAAGDLPPVAGTASGAAADPDAAGSQTDGQAAQPLPAAAPEIEAQPRATVQPRPARPRRTTQDEFTRPLGGFP